MKYTIKSKTKFYIGDPCYVLKDDIYDDIWGEKHNYEDGTIEVPAEDAAFAVVGTGGDGTYPGNQYKNGLSVDTALFGVDSGTICIAPIELCDKIEQSDDTDQVVIDYVGEVSIELDDNTILVAWEDNEMLIFLEDSSADDYDDDRRTEMPWDYGRHFDNYDDYEDDYDDPFETDWD